MPSRYELSVETFGDARALAAANGMRFSRPSEGCYQLRHLTRGWIINFYPRANGLSPRCYHDPHHRGPFLELPAGWTLLQAIQAAVQAEEAQRCKPPSTDT